MKCITFTDIRVKLTTLSYLARLFLTTTALVDPEISEGESLSLHLMKCKVVFYHNGFSSGNFGRKGTFFSSQTKGNVVLDQDSPRSGKFGRADFFSSSHPKLRILTTKALDLVEIPVRHGTKRNCFWSKIKVTIVLDHAGLRWGYFGRIVAFFTSHTRRLFLTTLSLNSWTLKHYSHRWARGVLRGCYPL